MPVLATSKRIPNVHEHGIQSLAPNQSTKALGPFAQYRDRLARMPWTVVIDEFMKELSSDVSMRPFVSFSTDRDDDPGGWLTT